MYIWFFVHGLHGLYLTHLDDGTTMDKYLVRLKHHGAMHGQTLFTRLLCVNPNVRFYEQVKHDNLASAAHWPVALVNEAMTIVKDVDGRPLLHSGIPLTIGSTFSGSGSAEVVSEILHANGVPVRTKAVCGWDIKASAVKAMQTVPGQTDGMFLLGIVSNIGRCRGSMGKKPL
jgi:hypothetical protein